jgi:RNA polymerase sigma-70 factor (ECF subfamily)
MTATYNTGTTRLAGDDGLLMAQIQSGSTDAFEGLYDRFCVRAYRVAWSVCRDDGPAEDAVQEAFISIWRNRGEYRPKRGSVAAWLLSVVRHRAIDIARHNGIHTKHRASENPIQFASALSDVAEQVVARAEAASLRVLLERLPDAQREVITLAFYGQLTHAEIAAQLRLPGGTVKGRMRLGLQKLRADIGQVAA